jgi:signal transduction histidine kinase
MLGSLTEIKTELSRMHELVQDYLSLARLTNLRREPEDLRALLEDVILACQDRLNDRGLACSFHDFDNLDRVFCHKGALRRALFNIMQNAIDAMSPGGTLLLRGWQENAWVHLAISDTGSGISEDQLPWLFIPFHTTKPDGTGLGLYVTHEIVTAHGGAIQVTSTPGQGTTVTVRLPLTPADEAPATEAAWTSA